MPFTVTDLRQYAYCPRIPYFTYVVPLARPVTPKMREGQEVHGEQSEWWSWAPNRRARSGATRPCSGVGDRRNATTM